MDKRDYVMQSTTSATEVKRTRELLGMTQKQFAEFLNVSQKTVEHWESGNTETKGPIVTLLRLLREDRFLPQRYEVPPMTTPLRIWYMFHQDVCTIIDVDERDQMIAIGTPWDPGL